MTEDHSDVSAPEQLDAVGPAERTDPAEAPTLAERPVTPDLLSRPLRASAVLAVAVVALLAIALATVRARNVTFNLFVDQGALNGIPRFSRERVTEIWRTMWDRAPDFGSVDLIRAVLVGGTAVFVVAGVALVWLAVVPGRGEWAADLGGEDVDRAPGA